MKTVRTLFLLIVLVALGYVLVLAFRQLAGGGVTVINNNVVNVAQPTAQPTETAVPTPWPAPTPEATATVEPTATPDPRAFDDPNFRSAGDLGNGDKAYDSEGFDSAGSIGGGD